MGNNNTCCLVFTKNPEPGNTKTRLIPALGKTGAYKVHLQLLTHTLSVASKTTDIDFKVYYTDSNPNSDDSQILLALTRKFNLTTTIQQGNELGERMYNAMVSCLKHYSHCIIIGSDCPEISKHYLIEANKKLLAGYDAVIGPAFDGGYVLIGLSNPVNEIFVNIDWGESTVLEKTINIFKKLNINYSKLNTLHDVDTVDDLQYLKLLPDT